MALSRAQQKAQAAWDRIESLGGHGVWERDCVVVSLANTQVADDDLALFHDFPFVQILDLSHTKVGDKGLVHLMKLPELQTLSVVDTKISRAALETYQRDHPTVSVTIDLEPRQAVNPFTGKPF